MLKNKFELAQEVQPTCLSTWEFSLGMQIGKTHMISKDYKLNTNQKMPPSFQAHDNSK